MCIERDALRGRPMVDYRAGWWCFQSLIGSAVGGELVHVIRRTRINFGQHRVERFVITTTLSLVLVEPIRAINSTGDRGTSVA